MAEEIKNIENIEAPKPVFEDENEIPVPTEEEAPVAQKYKPKRRVHWGRVLATVTGVGLVVGTVIKALSGKDDDDYEVK